MKPMLLSLALAALASVAEAQIGKEPVKTVAVPLLTGLTLTTTSVTGGLAVGGSVTVSQTAGAAGITVKLQSSNLAVAAVPVSVVIQAGAQTASFVIQTYPVATNPNVVTDPPSAEITGQIGSSAPRTTRLTVLPPALVSLAVTPTSIPGGTPATGEVRISGPAPSNGFSISLSSKPVGTEPPDGNTKLAIVKQGSIVSVPAQVTVSAGATAASFPVTTRGVTEPTPVQVTASRGTFSSKTAGLTLLPPTVAGLTLNPKDPIGGTSTTVSVALTAPAPPGGVTLTVSLGGWSSCAPAPALPGSLQIPAGTTTNSFTLTTQPGGPTWTTLRAGGMSVELFVREPILGALLLPTSVKGGSTVQGTLQMNGAAGPPNCNNTRKLESSNPLYAQVPATVLLTPGSNVATFQITTSAVTASQTVTLTVYGNVGYGYASRQATMTITP